MVLATVLAIGARLAEMKLQADAMSGISKIAYVPHLLGLYIASKQRGLVKLNGDAGV